MSIELHWGSYALWLLLLDKRAPYFLIAFFKVNMFRCVGRAMARMPRLALGMLSFAASMFIVPITLAAGLNDTGQTLCAASGTPPDSCVNGNGTFRYADTGNNPREDARYGRDAKAAAGLLTKIGGGNAGFDFTRIGNNGNPATNTTLGSGPTDWACTRDNVTGLTWEVKTGTSGLHNLNHDYTWYSTASDNGGISGAIGANTCSGTLSGPYNNKCNTENFVAAVNASMYCGGNDWRLPTRKELQSIVHSGTAGSAGSIDTAYFPNMPYNISTYGYFHWTASTWAPNASLAWYVNFSLGDVRPLEKTNEMKVRLVRSGL